jgi:hypothetical protein
MFRKSFLAAVLLTILFILEAKAQTTIIIYSSSISSIVRYKNENNQNTFNYTALYQIGRKDGSNGYYSGSQEDIYRSEHKFYLSSIPSNATISQVKLIYFASGICSSCKFKITQTTGTQVYGNLWNEIGNASTLESDISYGSSSRVSNSLLSAVNSARSRGVIYLGALSQNENSNLTEATVELRLEVTYTVPVTQVNITAQNNFIYGTIKVGVNASATQRTSPYPFTPTVGNTVNLEAQEQYYDGYYRIWNDTEAPLNPSKWEKIVGFNREFKSSNINYSFTAAENDNNSTYEAGLRKICNITFQNNFTGVGNSGTITVNGQNYSSPTSQFQVVELNPITASAQSQTINGIDYTFSQWNDGNTSNPRTFYPSENSTYTANFIGKPTNSGEYVNFGSTVGQPIVIYWTDNPNTNVTQYQIWRRVKHNGVVGADTHIGTVNRGVQTFTDYSYLLTASYSADLIWYDVRAFYSVENTYSDPQWSAVFGEHDLSPKINDGNFNNIITAASELPTKYSISNYPNPFNPTTTISYVIPSETRNLKDFSPDPSNDGRGRNDNIWVTLKVYDILGREIATLVNEHKQAGYHKIDFDASKLTSGVYIYTIKANNFTQSKKMMLAK